MLATVAPRLLLVAATTLAPACLIGGELVHDEDGVNEWTTSTGPATDTGTTTEAIPTTTESIPTTGGPGGTSTDTTVATDTSGQADDGTTADTVDILDHLATIAGLTVEEKPSPVDGYRYFLMAFDQPADHDDPDGLHFSQQLTLLHRDTDAPLVLVTEGYFVNTNNPGLGEPAALLAGNQLSIEHRFFVPSRPQPADWATLTITQAATDHHRIAQAFKPIYEGSFVATGASKGGMASVYFRRFFPDDVDATIAYVAPQSYGDADPRYLGFVAKLGSQSCRDALAAAQRELLLRRDAMTMFMQAEADDGFTYEDHLGFDRALETAVLELPFTFWQYGNATHCAEIPTQAATDAQWWDFINTFNAPSYWSDYQTELYEPYFFQAATQLGYPAYSEAAVADLLKHPGVDVAATYVLEDKMPTLDKAVMPDIADWLATAGTRMMFVYGQNDPYTAAAFELGDATDSFVFTVPLGNHGAEILQLPDADRKQALAALHAWTGVKPMPLVLPHAPRLRVAPR